MPQLTRFGVSAKYRALVYSPPAAGTWAILDRDGANREVAPYLSSLGGGELGTGAILSPPFSIAAGTTTITFTICGHDGQGGGQDRNFIVLVDAASGDVLRKTVAPGNDAVQARSWEVGKLKGRRVRIRVEDGIAAGGFAWLGIGKIDAGPQLRIDFRQGMPGGWKEVAARPKPESTVPVEGGIPFAALRRTMVPAAGAAEIPCGFAAERLFFLGCTVFSGRPLEVHGHIKIVYRGGRKDSFPLMVGYTLDGAFKLLSRSEAIHLHPSGDPFQHYLVIAPRRGVIEAIKLRRDGEHPRPPSITAITCEIKADAVAGSAADSLRPLPDCKPGPEEQAWIRSHAISPSAPEMEEIEAEIRRAHKM
jgi:hypothetical protein